MNGPERREGWQDPETGERITPASVQERLERLERRHRRDQLENRILYATAIALASFVAYLFVNVQDLRRERGVLQQATNDLICRGQARALVNDIDNATLQRGILERVRPMRPEVTEALDLIDGIEERSLAQMEALRVDPADVRRARSGANVFRCTLPSQARFR